MDLKEENIIQARKIWEYLHVNHQLQKADCILVLGSHDTRVAERGAELFLSGYAPLILFSGGLGRLTEGFWIEPEADKFARIAREMGVPEDKILIENRSTNTGENIALAYELLLENEIDVKSFIVVQKPYMERRAYATFKKQWPGNEVQIMVTSPQISFDAYPNSEISLPEVISIIMGDLQRMKIYYEQGFQIYQEVPPEIWEAYEILKQKGFEDHLI
ncbi:YdcF family protein [soil metagenome]